MRVLEDWLPIGECIALMDLAGPRLKPSKVWDVASGSEKADPYRVSEQCFFERGENDFIRNLEARIAHETNTPVENGEGIQVVRYGIGGHFGLHGDYFDEGPQGNRSVLNRGGQRTDTFMVYLNDVEEGGATNFPRLNFKGIPSMGRALHWRNIIDGCATCPPKVNELTMHIAEPVVKGEKYIFTKWIRERHFV